MDTPVTRPPPPPLLADRMRLVDPLDWAMLALAVLSVGLLCYEFWGDASELWRARIVAADFVICGIFAVEFGVRWRRERWARSYLWRNWYEVLGMIPLAHPALRGLRLLRVVRIVVLLA